MAAEPLPGLGRDICRAAERFLLMKEPLRDPDRMGRLASLLLESAEPGSIALLLLDGKYRLLTICKVSGGPGVEITDAALTIPGKFRESGAKHAVLCLAPAAGPYGFTREDERIASRLARYCKQQGIPLSECVVAWLNGYETLFRKFGYTP